MHDYHIHTSLCKHAEGKIVDYVEAAISQGIFEICFTDHIPLPEGFDAEHRMSPKELDTYFDQIEQCKAKYRQITILTGIEADYMEGYENYLKTILKRYPFDLVVMSVHYIKKWGTKEWVFNYTYTKETLRAQYNDYFNVMYKGIQTGLFDVVGHLDIIKRPGLPVLKSNFRDVDRVLDAAKKTGMSIELNTSGLRKSIFQTYPHMDIIEMAVEKNIPIVLSSDAHRPEDVGYGFDDIYNRLFQFPDLLLGQYSQRECKSRKIVIPQPDVDYLE